MPGFEHRMCDSKPGVLSLIIQPSENEPPGLKGLGLSHLQRSVQPGIYDTEKEG